MMMVISAHNVNCRTVIIVEAGENLLRAIERYAPNAKMIGCRNGGCGVCRIQVLDGKIRLGRMSRRFVDHQMQLAGYALACRVFPESDINYRFAPLSESPFHTKR